MLVAERGRVPAGTLAVLLALANLLTNVPPPPPERPPFSSPSPSSTPSHYPRLDSQQKGRTERTSSNTPAPPHLFFDPPLTRASGRNLRSAFPPLPPFRMQADSSARIGHRYQPSLESGHGPEGGALSRAKKVRLLRCSVPRSSGPAGVLPSDEGLGAGERASKQASVLS